MENTPVSQQTAPVTQPQDTNYINNPFMVAVKGIELLFKKAQSVGILLAILAALGLLSNVGRSIVPDFSNSTSNNSSYSATSNSSNQTEVSPSESSQESSDVAKSASSIASDVTKVPAFVWIIIAIVVAIAVLIAVFFGIIFKGISDYTASKIARGTSTNLGEALGAVFHNFWGYTWVLIIVQVKVFLWSLLLIVPGIIKGVQYSLAGVAFFDKNTRGNASLDESRRLTKGAWLTTFASQGLFNIATLGQAASLATPGTLAILYRQYDTNDTKPKPHWLSILTLVITIVFFLLIALIVLIGIITFAHYLRINRGIY
jgi:hypothetical protein